MCMRSIRCLTRTACDTVCDAITYFTCQRPIYACVGAIFGYMSSCCVDIWHNYNVPPQRAAYPVVAIPIVPAQHELSELPVVGEEGTNE